MVKPVQVHVDVVLSGATGLWRRMPRPLAGTRLLAAAGVLIATATLIGKGLSYWLPYQSVTLVYLLFVVFAAVGLGTKSGLASAFLAFLAYNFFFIPPIYTFTIADPQEVFALFVFLAVAMVTGSLSGRMRDAADTAQRQAEALAGLNDFAGQMSGTRNLGAIHRALANQASQTLHGHAVVLTLAGDKPEMVATSPPNVQLDTADWQAAQRCLRSGEITFASAPTWPGARFEFRPIRIDTATVAVIGFAPVDGQRMVPVESEAAMQTLLAHAAIAIERTQLEAEGAAARDATERERIRSTLLSSLSHDLKTPLASILGAASSLRELGTQLPAEAQADLLAAIEEEASRLSQFVANLLDLTRLDTEAPDLKREWIDIADVAQSAVARSRRFYPGSSISLTALPNAQLVRGDAMLMERVVFNLIDNAVKFSASGQPITVEVAVAADTVVLSVRDQGRGIPADQIERVFDKFYRVRDGDRDIQGTGLGLTICKRVVEGMGGTIAAMSPIANGRGTAIVVTLPYPPQYERTCSKASQ